MTTLTTLARKVPAAANEAPIAQLLRFVEQDEHFNLVPVGVSLHDFSEPARRLCGLPAAVLHRATTVLTKQVKAALTSDHRLEAIRGLVTDPYRPALPDGTIARTLCGEHWTEVRAVAEQRAAAAVEGATTFGEAAILRLAATRAAMPSCPWWGTRGWTVLVDTWSRREPAAGRRSVAPLLLEPEFADDELLTAILGRAVADM